MAIEKDLLTEIDEAATEAAEKMHAAQEQTLDEDDQQENDQQEDDKQEEDDQQEEGDQQEDDQQEEDDQSGDDKQQEGDERDDDQQDQSLSAPPERSTVLVERAVRAGFSLAEARAFPSDQALGRACEVIEQSQRQSRKQTEEDEEDPLAVFDTLNTEEFEPEVVELLGTLAGQIKAQREELRALKAGQEQTTQVSQEAAAREVEVWFDGQVQSLGTDFQDTLGQGTYRSLAPGSSQLAMRDAIAEQMAVQIAGYQAVGRPMPPREEMFQAAAKVVLAKEFAELERKQIQSELRKRARQHVQRGSKGEKVTDNELSPEEDAARAIDERFGG